MLNQYPWWKYLLVALVVLIGALYALPNLYGEDPALQISADRSGILDEARSGAITDALSRAGLEPKAVEPGAERLLIRFHDTEDQLAAAELVKQELGRGYTVALNLASNEPDWLRAINAQPMYLGLDLRGGVYFLLEVDMAAAVDQALERYNGELRTLLRENRVRYQSVEREGEALRLDFGDAEVRTAAQALIEEALPNLVRRESDLTLYLELAEEEVTEIRRFALQQNITTLRNRVNELGVAEPVIQQQGNDRIVVQLPGVQDTARAKEILGATATLEFRLADDDNDPREAQARGRAPAGTELYFMRSGEPVLLHRRVIITGDYITNAASGFDAQSGTPNVSITLDGKGGRIMSNYTRDKVGRSMAVVFIENKVTTEMVDGEPVKRKEVIKEVINRATIRDQLGSRFQITGLDSPQEARDLALLLRAGALAAPVEIIEERTVGPSLGRDNIEQGFQAALIGFVAVLVLMALYYRLFGVFAGVALAVNLVLIIAVLSLLQATLTLPGIAGIVLTVGMAVDANVLIFERIREELRIGNSPQAAIHAGYERAFGTIFDANITTLIATVVLFSLGTGPVKGFAVTLMIGIATSMFTAILGTRALTNLIYGGRRLQTLSI